MFPWSYLRQVAPIDTLPVELIAYIFVLATHGSNDDAGPPDENAPINLESITFPLVLSTVNKRWRHIAHSTSALWTSLCVTIHHLVRLQSGADDDLFCPSPPPELDPTHLLTYLSLSGRYPIDILIDARDPDWDFSENEFVFSLCFPAQPR